MGICKRVLRRGVSISDCVLWSIFHPAPHILFISSSLYLPLTFSLFCFFISYSSFFYSCVSLIIFFFFICICLIRFIYLTHLLYHFVLLVFLLPTRKCPKHEGKLLTGMFSFPSWTKAIDHHLRQLVNDRFLMAVGVKRWQDWPQSSKKQARGREYSVSGLLEKPLMTQGGCHRLELLKCNSKWS